MCRPGRPTKEFQQLCEMAGEPVSLRELWRQNNRHDRMAAQATRERRKAIDQSRPKCRCEAYPWPHRPTGGLCRYPDPPIERYQPEPGGRPYRIRYAGLRRQIARANRLHPIRDRAVIQSMMLKWIALAKQLHRQNPKIKFRNMEITLTGIAGYWTDAGPTM